MNKTFKAKTSNSVCYKNYNKLIKRFKKTKFSVTEIFFLFRESNYKINILF